VRQVDVTGRPRVARPEGLPLARNELANHSQLPRSSLIAVYLLRDNHSWLPVGLCGALADGAAAHEIKIDRDRLKQ
jgi:hypothetical protein